MFFLLLYSFRDNYFSLLKFYWQLITKFGDTKTKNENELIFFLYYRYFPEMGQVLRGYKINTNFISLLLAREI